MTRTLYVVRHAEAAGEAAEGLTEAGRRQAEALGERLAGVGFSTVFHGPLPRAAQTASIVVSRLSVGASGASLGMGPVRAAAVVACDEAGDYLPFAPVAEGLPEAFARLVGSYSAAERAAGAALAAAAVRRFMTVSGEEDTADLVVTHNFTAAWLVRHALGAPPERWLGLNQGNAALTVIRCHADRPPALVTFNDMSHLPANLRWTGFPAYLRV